MRITSLLACLIIFAAQTSFAQGSTSPYYISKTGETYSQMINVSNYYRTANSAWNTTVGTLKDTTSGTTVLTLSTANFHYMSILYPLADSFQIMPLQSEGKIKFTAAAYASTTTDTLTVVLQESSDGILWTTCTQLSGGQTSSSTYYSQSLYPTSGTVPVTCEFLVPAKYDRFYQITFTGKSAKASRVYASYHVTPNISAIQINKL